MKNKAKRLVGFAMIATPFALPVMQLGLAIYSGGITQDALVQVLGVIGLNALFYCGPLLLGAWIMAGVHLASSREKKQ